MNLTLIRKKMNLTPIRKSISIAPCTKKHKQPKKQNPNWN